MRASHHHSPPSDWQPPRNKRRYEAVDGYKPSSLAPKRRRHDSNSPVPQSATSTHTKKERKTNPSTRIHSLKKLLSGDVLPPEQRRDKERELSGLLFDQEKERMARATSQMIKRYHMVRFFERKKAQRKLKRAQRAKEKMEGTFHSIDDSFDTDPRDSTMAEMEQRFAQLESDIHEAEVDVKYTMYSPLGEKYISIYVEENRREHAEPRRSSHQTKREELSRLDEEKEEPRVRVHAHETAKRAKVAVEASKPPLWYEVEKCMKGEDDVTVKRQLEALRDRKPAAMEVVAVRTSKTGDKATGAGRKSGRVRFEEDGLIDRDNTDPKDSDGIEDLHRQGADEDEKDGGFFEE